MIIAAVCATLISPGALAICFESKESIMQEISRGSSQDRILKDLIGVINRKYYKGKTPLLFTEIDVYARILSTDSRLILDIDAPLANIHTQAPVEICERNGQLTIRDLTDPKSETPVRIGSDELISIEYNKRKIVLAPDPSTPFLIHADGVRTAK